MNTQSPISDRSASLSSEDGNSLTRSARRALRRAPARPVVGGFFCVAVAASLFGGIGCAAADMEESVGKVQEALDISTWDQLVAMGSTGSYKLTANINAAGKTWTPKSFSGTFDGDDKTISNLSINNGSFFSSLTNATIKDLKFTSMTLTGGGYGIGGLASSATNTTIDNCAVHATINVTATTVGGLLGKMTSGKIYRSYAKGSITGSIAFVGGLVGTAEKSSAGVPSILESYAQVTVNPSTSTTWPVVAGGILGTGYA
ncbi:MAG TPA: ZmpA/ZmpB/ZmpC family metallo-endopeptidase-related protein, partial [Polyangiaceae bacterium]